CSSSLLPTRPPPTSTPFPYTTLFRSGQVADLPPDPSPIQLLTEGVYKGKGFQVVGRILYEYEQGGWNEWHIVFSDGASGWLSDRSEEHTSELQSRFDLVCRLLLEKKK